MVVKEADVQALLQEEEKRFIAYLEEIASSSTQSERTFCCNTSRSLYCPECYQVFVPTKEWPQCIRNNDLELPFAMDIILGRKERRNSSSGVQLMAIRQMMMQSGAKPNESLTKDLQCSRQSGKGSSPWWATTSASPPTAPSASTRPRCRRRTN